jgi:hypothetical protein
MIPSPVSRGREGRGKATDEKSLISDLKISKPTVRLSPSLPSPV